MLRSSKRFNASFFPAHLNPAEPLAPRKALDPNLPSTPAAQKQWRGSRPSSARVQLSISQGGLTQRKNNPTWPIGWRAEGGGMSGYGILVPLSSEYHFQSGVKYRQLAGLRLTAYGTVPWYYSTVACCFFLE